MILDPCTGTGRFLLDFAWRHRDKKLVLFGVDLDLDLYRAALVNMKLYAFGMPYFETNLQKDIGLDSAFQKLGQMIIKQHF